MVHRYAAEKHFLLMMMLAISINRNLSRPNKYFIGIRRTQHFDSLQPTQEWR